MSRGETISVCIVLWGSVVRLLIPGRGIIFLVRLSLSTEDL